MNTCYLCGGNSLTQRPGKVRDRDDLDVLECRSCGLVFLSSFDHIQKGFYENSQMHVKDDSITNWVNQSDVDDERRYNAFKSLLTNQTVLDFGCGAGGFLSRAQKIATVAVGLEPEARLQDYFRKEQLTVFTELTEINQSFDVITLFHVLEHIPDPINILKQLKEKLCKAGQIIIEVPNANDALLTLYSSDAFSRFTYWSCHLFLFSVNTLSLLAKKAGLHINFIKQVQRYPLSNHLYWLAKQKPGGHIHWGFLDSQALHEAFEKQLGLMGVCDTLLASLGGENG